MSEHDKEGFSPPSPPLLAQLNPSTSRFEQREVFEPTTTTPSLIMSDGGPFAPNTTPQTPPPLVPSNRRYWHTPRPPYPSKRVTEDERIMYKVRSCSFSRVACRLPPPPQRQEVLAPPYPSKRVTEDKRIRYAHQISFFLLLTNTHFPLPSKTSECARFRGWHVVCRCRHHHLPPPTCATSLHERVRSFSGACCSPLPPPATSLHEHLRSFLRVVLFAATTTHHPLPSKTSAHMLVVVLRHHHHHPLPQK